MKAPRVISPTTRQVLALTTFLLAASLSLHYVRAAISISTTTPYTQDFNGIGTTSTATLPTDFRADRLGLTGQVRTVGTYSAAGTATTQAGGANLSTSAANGIYNFGAGTTTTGADRAIGFLSSGTATFSGNLYAQLQNNTGSALTGLQISYNVEKYRNGSNPAGFRIQMFYSTDGSTWTSAGSGFLTSFSADANNNGFATAPGTTIAVPSTNLSVAIPDTSTFYLAWNYSVSSGTTTTNAQALAIDDVSILGIGASGGPTNPTGTGAANPNSVQAGNSTLLTVNVTPGTNPTSSGLAVTADLSSIGGGAAQSFFDDGTHGDITAGDNLFSFQATVSAATSPGAKTIPATIGDTQARSGSASIALTVTSASTPPTGSGSANPNSLMAGAATLLTVNVTPGSNPTSTAISVAGDLSSIGGSAAQSFFDDGTHGDVTPNDNLFSFQAIVANATSAGAKSLPVTVSDAQSRSSSTSIPLTVQPPPPPTTVKISQVYGGGGNSGSTYTNDFIELYNQGTTAVDISGWSVQYSSAGATTWTPTPVCVSGPCMLQPGHYFLVQEALGAGGTTALPTADVIGSINLSGTNGKVALVASTTALSGACPTGGAIVDLVGYGTANCFETAATGALTNTTAAVRRGNGCIDTDNNASDFVTIGPIPRNSSSPVNSCGGDPNQPSGLGVASPSSLDPASNTLLTVRVTPASTPPSTGIQVSADLSSIGGPASQSFFDDGSHGDAIAADNTFSFQTTVGAFIPTGVKNIVATITDAEGRTATAPITLTVQSPTCGVERWSVKTGTDPDAALVDLNNPVPATIAALGAITPPADPPGPPLNARIAPTETTVYVVDATMTLFKKETDVDYHIVLQDDTGHTMVSEIPCPCCVGASSPFAAAVANARAKFDARFTATSFFQSVSVPVRVTGVGFFDFIHGQTGVAPNGIELHPILDIIFDPAADLSISQSVSPNPVVTGGDVTYTVTVANAGPQDAASVTVTDNLPGATSFVSCNVSGGQGAVCGGTGNNRSISFTSLQAGTSATITLVANLSCAVTDGSSISNTATVSSTTADPNSSNNTSAPSTNVSAPPPQITCPANMSVSTDAGQCTRAVTFTPTVSGTCSSGATVVCAPASGSTFAKGVTTVTCTATNPSGSQASCSFTVTVVDSQPPTLTCPANITRSTDPNLCSAVVNYAAPSATDNCPGVGAPVCTPPSGSTFPKGTTTVSCSVTDASSNSATCSFTVTVNDTQPPQITCPANISTPTAVGTCAAVVVYSIAATDNCPGVAVVASPPSGSSFPKGVTTVTAMATDTSGNMASCTFTVTVVDTEPPQITCPSNITRALVPGCPLPSGAPVSYSAPVATDNCPGVTAACTPPSGSNFAVGTTLVTCTATDASGNTANCGFSVTLFTGCLQDDSNPRNVVLYNHLTGEYRFCCDGTLLASGTGAVQVHGCQVMIQVNGSQRVQIQVNTTSRTGSALLQSPVGTLRCAITDRDITNNSCVCQ